MSQEVRDHARRNGRIIHDDWDTPPRRSRPDRTGATPRYRKQRGGAPEDEDVSLGRCAIRSGSVVCLRCLKRGGGLEHLSSARLRGGIMERRAILVSATVVAV